MTQLDPVQQAIADARALSNAAAPPPPAPAASWPPAGWTAHPSAPGYFYQGQEVITEAQLRSRVAPPPPAPPAAPPAPPAAPAAPAAYTAPQPQAYAAAPASNVATVPPATAGNGAVAAYDPNLYQPGRKLSMAEMMAGRTKLNVDNFMGVDENGIKVRFLRDDPRGATLGNKLGTSLQIKVDFLADVRLCFGVRYKERTTGDFIYVRTGDRVISDDGTPWSSVIAKAMGEDATCKGDYPSVDICGVLTHPFNAMDGTMILAANTRIGFSTSVMNWQAFYRCYEAMLADGHLEYDEQTRQTSGEVYMNIGYKPMENKNRNKYGIFTFEHAGNVEAVDDTPAAPAVAAPAAPAAGTPPVPPAPVVDKPKRGKKAAEAAPPAPPAAPAAPAAGETPPPAFLRREAAEQEVLPPAPPAPAGLPPAPPGFRYDQATNTFVPA